MDAQVAPLLAHEERCEESIRLERICQAHRALAHVKTMGQDWSIVLTHRNLGRGQLRIEAR